MMAQIVADREIAGNADGLPPTGCYQALLPNEHWEALPRAVKRRFGAEACEDRKEPKIYVGYIITHRQNWAGKLLAQIIRPFGAPLPLDTKEGDATIVSVLDNATGNGQIWSRLYARQAGVPQVIQSTKTFSGPTGLEEFIGLGLSIPLALHATNRGLEFKSSTIRLNMLGRTITSPRQICAGLLKVVHRDEGDDEFTFIMSLEHPVFGDLMYLEARYRDDVV